MHTSWHCTCIYINVHAYHCMAFIGSASNARKKNYRRKFIMKCGKYSRISIGYWTAADLTQHKANREKNEILQPGEKRIDRVRAAIYQIVHQMKRKPAITSRKNPNHKYLIDVGINAIASLHFVGFFSFRWAKGIIQKMTTEIKEIYNWHLFRLVSIVEHSAAIWFIPSIQS